MDEKQSANAFSGRMAEKEQTAEKNTFSGNKISIQKAPVSESEQERKEIYKILRKPRTKKFMKALRTMDILSAGDEQIIEEMKREAGVSIDSDMTFQPEDIETFKKKIAEVVAEEIRKEERREELKRSTKLLDIISPCGLPDCVIHRITTEGEILEHFNEEQVSSMSPKVQKIRDIVMDYGGFSKWSCVEVYPTRLVHRTAGGDTIRIIELDEADWEDVD